MVLGENTSQIKIVWHNFEKGEGVLSCYQCVSLYVELRVPGAVDGLAIRPLVHPEVRVGFVPHVHVPQGRVQPVQHAEHTDKQSGPPLPPVRVWLRRARDWEAVPFRRRALALGAITRLQVDPRFSARRANAARLY